MQRQDFIKIKIEREINPLEIYSEVFQISNNCYLVKSKMTDLYGIINSQFKEVIPCEYSKENAYPIIKKDLDLENSSYDDFKLSQKEGMYGYIDQNSNIVIPHEYQKAFPFSEGLAGVKEDRIWGFINKRNKLVIPYQFDYVKSFNEGLAPVEKESKWGYINKIGKVEIPYIYDDANPFFNGVALVKQGDNFYLIDKNGTKKMVNIQEEMYIKTKEDIPSDALNIQVLGYFGILDLSNGQVLVEEDDYNKYIQKVIDLETYDLVNNSFNLAETKMLKK